MKNKKYLLAEETIKEILHDASLVLLKWMATIEKGFLSTKEKALIGTAEAQEAAKKYIKLANETAKNFDAIEGASDIIRVYNCKAMALLGMIPAF